MKTFDISLGKVMTSLLARKKLAVEYGDFDTAYYVPSEKKVKLPINWIALSRDAFNVFSGHEVSHALHTPDRFFSDAKEYGFSLLMILEDARIESLIKDEFPGIITSFKNGYKTLLKEDFFGLDEFGHEYEKFSFIDRINLKAKCGENLSIPFTDDEKEFFGRVMSNRDYEGILELAKEYKERFKGKNDKNKDKNGLDPDGTSESESSGIPHEYEYCDGDGDSSLEENNVDGVAETDKEDFDDDGEDDGDDDSNSNSESGTDNSFEEGITEKIQREKLSSLSKPNDNIQSIDDVFEIPEWDKNVSKQVLGYKKGLEMRYANGVSPSMFLPKRANKKILAKRKEVQKNASLMAIEFNRKMSASKRVNTKMKETGNLDMSRLVHYKYSDEIFKNKKIEPKGKNHGFVIFVDHSSSMLFSMESVYTQLLTFAYFCKMIKVPYRIYSFTNNHSVYKRMIEGSTDYLERTQYRNEFFPRSRYQLELFSSKMSQKDFDKMVDWFIPLSVSYKKASRDIPENNFIDALNGTPLVETFVDSFATTDHFLKENPKIEKLKTIYITDGEGNAVTIPNNIKYKNQIFCHEDETPKPTNTNNDYYYTLTPSYTANKCKFLGGVYEKIFGNEIINIKIWNTPNVFLFGKKKQTEYESNGIFEQEPRKNDSAVFPHDNLWSYQYNMMNTNTKYLTNRLKTNSTLKKDDYDDDEEDLFDDLEQDFMRDGKIKKLESKIFKIMADQIFS